MKSLPETVSDIPSWFELYCQPVLSAGYRAALLLSGDKQWAKALNASLPGKNQRPNKLLVSLHEQDALSPEKANTQLGHEYDEIIFDAYEQFNVDAFGAISGTLRGGGLLVLLVPELSGWQEYTSSPFLKRLISISSSYPAVFFIEQGKSLVEPGQPLLPEKTYQQCDKPFATCDQKQVVETVLDVISQGKNIPVVITSDRGRGKTSALGLVATQLIQQENKNIIVTAPRLSTSKPLFEIVKNLLPQAQFNKNKLVYKESSISFWASDALIEAKPACDLVFVDEAAAIPLTMLQKILERYGNVVFSTTIHGYEGTGRGFSLKFNKILDAHAPGWLNLTMHMPVRWALDDPIEHWVDRLLCLDAELADVPVDISKNECKVVQIRQNELANDEEKLSSLFALLVYAHYRTKPSDLQYLLDDDSVRIYCLEYGEHIIGALVVNDEGGFTQELSSAIYRGERRPTGHLLAQTLTFHAGCEQAATLNYARIMRIAIHPELQGKGLGSYFLNEVVNKEKQYSRDIIGTSFSSTLELLRFWQHCGFELVRMGFTRDHVSGAHSAVMIIPVSERGDSVFDEARERFSHGLANWLAEPLGDLPIEMKQFLEPIQSIPGNELNDEDWQDIHSFINTHRGYEACMTAIHKLLALSGNHVEELTAEQQELIKVRVIGRYSWSETVQQCGLSGKNEAVQLLRLAVGELEKKLK